MKRPKIALWISLFLLPQVLVAQPEFDQRLNFDQIRDIIENGDKKNLRQQGLALYQWAHFEDRKFGDSDSAYHYMVHSMETFLKIPDSAAYYRARIDMGDWFAKSGLTDDGLSMQMEALNYARRAHKDTLEALILIRLSRNYMFQQDTASMLKYRRLFREKNELLKDTLLDISVLMDEVDRLQRNGRAKDAIDIANRALGLAKRVNKPEALAWSQYKVGYLQTLVHNYKGALDFLREAAQKSDYVDENLRRDIFHDLSKTYAQLDSTEAAYWYALQYGEKTNEIIVRNQKAAMKETTRQVAIQEKVKIIAGLEQINAETQTKVKYQRLIAGALAVALAAVLLAMFFIIRDYRHRIHVEQVIAGQNEEINQRKIRELEDSLKIKTMQSMLEGQEHERERIAHDLHDSIGGLVAAVKLQVENLPVPKTGTGEKENEGILKIKALLDETAAETRLIARNLSPRSLSQFGLINAIRDLTVRVSNPNGPVITFHSFGDFSDLEEQFSLICYRIVQELLQNSLKHAKAAEILVQLTRSDATLALLVEDDGIGFDPQTVLHGMGTGNIEQRVQFLKGDVNVQAKPGQGTSTLITIAI